MTLHNGGEACSIITLISFLWRVVRVEKIEQNRTWGETKRGINYTEGTIKWHSEKQSSVKPNYIKIKAVYEKEMAKGHGFMWQPRIN